MNVRRIAALIALIFAALSFVLVQIAPVAAQTDTGTTASQVQSLMTEINSLLAQINSLGTSTPASTSSAEPSSTPSTTTTGTAPSSTGPTYACIALYRPLSLGSRGSDVSELQRFLAVDPSIYPEGLVTGYYGAATEAAVERWQSAHGIVSSGDPTSTGFGAIGPRTMNAMADCSTSAAPVKDCTTPAQVPADACPNGTLSTTYSADKCSVQWSCNTVSGTTYSSGTNPGQICPVIALVCPVGETPQTGPNCQQSCAGPTLSAQPSSGFIPSYVSFVTSALPSPSSGYYLIQFGDGTLNASLSPLSCASGTCYSGSHTYGVAGTFTVQVLAQSPGGVDTTVATTTVSMQQGGNILNGPINTSNNMNGISGPACSIECGAGSYASGPSGSCDQTCIPTSGLASLSAAPNPGRAPLTVIFSGSVANSTSYELNFGDGSTPVIQVQQSDCAAGTTCTPSAIPIDQTHTYGSAGTYVATLSSGDMTVDSVTITVTN